MEVLFFDYWGWLSIAAILFIFEIFASTGYFLIFIGASSVLVALIVYIFPGISHNFQFFIFSFLSIVLVALWWYFLKSKKIMCKKEKNISLNERGCNLIGRECVLQSPILHGKGTININGSIWKVIGNDLPVGTAVKIVEQRGIKFVVEPINEVSEKYEQTKGV